MVSRWKKYVISHAVNGCEADCVNFLPECQASTPTASMHRLATKKNRVEQGGADEESPAAAAKEAGNVGEVRKKVAKMNWKEGATGKGERADDEMSTSSVVKEDVEDAGSPTSDAGDGSVPTVEGQEDEREDMQHEDDKAKAAHQRSEEHAGSVDEHAMDHEPSPPVGGQEARQDKDNETAALSAAKDDFMDVETSEAGRKRKLIERHSSSVLGTLGGGAADNAKRIKEDSELEVRKHKVLGHRFQLTNGEHSDYHSQDSRTPG
jgi:hypothetical protein